MPRHIARLLMLMVGFGLLAYGAKQLFTVGTFYQYGHYQGKSVAEIAAEKPKYKGTAYCVSCHAEQVAVWSNGVHNRPDIGKVVKCEVCHGPGGGRDAELTYVPVSTGPDHPKNMKMAVPADTRKLCTLCHERMTGRPLQQRQIVVAEHAGTQQCAVCHNPHSPRLNLVSASSTAPAGDAAAGKAKAAACVGCHGAEGISANLPGPTLAGQRAAYLVDALKEYLAGGRSDPMMNAGVQGLSNDDAANVAAYFADAKCVSSLDAAKQATLQDKATPAKCAACHGADGNSANPSWPNLIGQSKAYLANALKAYKGGARKNGMMSGVAKGLSDADIENAAAYYANAACK